MATGTELLALLDSYFDAVGSGDPAKLPLADDVRFTENGQALALGRGLWATANGAHDRRAVAVADAGTGQAAGWGLVTEAGEEQLLAVRLRVNDAGLLREIETMVVRPAGWNRPGAGFPPSMRAPYPGLHDLVPDGPGKATRAELIAAADGYFSGVSLDDADLIPVADDAIRIENGRQTVRNTTGEGFPSGGSAGAGGSGGDDFELGRQLGVKEQIRRGFFHYIENLRDRRFVVDVDRGLVIGLCFFDHPGLVREATWRSPFLTPNSMMVFEAFKVTGGLIRHISAIGALMPYGMPHGW